MIIKLYYGFCSRENNCHNVTKMLVLIAATGNRWEKEDIIVLSVNESVDNCGCSLMWLE